MFVLLAAKKRRKKFQLVKLVTSYLEIILLQNLNVPQLAEVKVALLLQTLQM